MPLSTNQALPKELANDVSRDYRPNASQNTSAIRSHFAPLTAEEKTTYRKWRRATIMFYGAFAFVIAAVLIAIGPTDPSNNVSETGAYSTTASIGPGHPH